MPFSFDSYLGVHEPALTIRAKRAQVLASNLANVDTPNYKARDIKFNDALNAVTSGNTAGMLRNTHANHIQPESFISGYQLQYRIPNQPSLDGNTVEQQVEMAAYSDNAMRYLANLRFLSGKFNTLRTAIRGQ
ncbi:MAG: flagellar basal body rod protein FlgB [Thioalkalispiraceae bacterium]|jgi:flagellar basal-body rod protein FlgB